LLSIDGKEVSRSVCAYRKGSKQMTETIWGAEIPVTITNGEKPEFVSAGKRCAIWTKDAWHGEGGNMKARDWTWHGGITAIKLLFDSPYYKKVDEMTSAPVTPDALEAAARYAGHSNPKNSAESAAKNPQESCSLRALARMIMQHKPDLVAESFDARTEREFDQISTRGAVEYDYLVNMYRHYIQQHIKDAKP
jgi:hypothetical protein